jgi:hypothetical protein
MARIKAKPMNRIPVTPIAGGPVPIKNGYRTTPPPPPAVFDPAAAAYAAAAQPRLSKWYNNANICNSCATISRRPNTYDCKLNRSGKECFFFRR